MECEAPSALRATIVVMNIPVTSPPKNIAMPRFGIGTWRMGERSFAAQTEIAIIKAAIERGVTLIDTAEMYGDGGAETVIGRAIAGIPIARENLFVVSKVYPHNASREGTIGLRAKPEAARHGLP